MENDTILDLDTSGSMTLSPLALNHLRETAKWAKLIAILGFIMVGLLVIMAIAILFLGSALGTGGVDELGMAGFMSGGILSFFYLIIAAFYFFPTLYLYRFATRTKNAINTASTTTLTDGLGNLKSLYKFIGILSVITLAFYALGLIFALLGGLGAMFAG